MWRRTNGGREGALRRSLWDPHRACSGLLRTSAPVTHPRAHRMGKPRVSCERKQVASSPVVSIPHDFLDLDGRLFLSPSLSLVPQSLQTEATAYNNSINNEIKF